MEMDGTKVKNNLFSKGQRIVSDRYRDGHDNTEWNGPSIPKKEKVTGIGRKRITFGK